MKISSLARLCGYCGYLLGYLRLSGYRLSVIFWRTYDQKEIDFVEERAGRLWGFECKWKAKGVKPPKDFIETYKNSKFTVITNDNYFDIIG